MPAKIRKKKPKKRKLYAEFRIDADNPPGSMSDILESLFPKNPAMKALAEYLVFRARDNGPWFEEEWLGVLLEFLTKYSRVYNIGVEPEAIDDLYSYYNNLKNNDIYRSRLRDEIFKKAKDIGLDMGLWNYRYYSVLKRLLRAGLLYKANWQYGKSTGLYDALDKMIKALVRFYSGEEEPPTWLQE